MLIGSFEFIDEKTTFHTVTRTVIVIFEKFRGHSEFLKNVGYDEFHRRTFRQQQVL